MHEKICLNFPKNYNFLYVTFQLYWSQFTIRSYNTNICHNLVSISFLYHSPTILNYIRSLLLHHMLIIIFFVLLNFRMITNINNSIYTMMSQSFYFTLNAKESNKWFVSEEQSYEWKRNNHIFHGLLSYY